MAKIVFKEMTAQELTAKSHELRHELFNLRVQQATAALTNLTLRSIVPLFIFLQVGRFTGPLPRS